MIRLQLLDSRLVANSGRLTSLALHHRLDFAKHNRAFGLRDSHDVDRLSYHRQHYARSRRDAAHDDLQLITALVRTINNDPVPAGRSGSHGCDNNHLTTEIDVRCGRYGRRNNRTVSLTTETNTTSRTCHDLFPLLVPGFAIPNDNACRSRKATVNSIGPARPGLLGS